MYSIIYMIRIRFFGSGELIQRTFRAARYSWIWTDKKHTKNSFVWADHTTSHGDRDRERRHRKKTEKEDRERETRQDKRRRDKTRRQEKMKEKRQDEEREKRQDKTKREERRDKR